jgi:hypothetical protein
VLRITGVKVIYMYRGRLRVQTDAGILLDIIFGQQIRSGNNPSLVEAPAGLERAMVKQSYRTG